MESKLIINKYFTSNDSEITKLNNKIKKLEKLKLYDKEKIMINNIKINHYKIMLNNHKINYNSNLIKLIKDYKDILKDSFNNKDKISNDIKKLLYNVITKNDYSSLINLNNIEIIKIVNLINDYVDCNHNLVYKKN